MRIPSQYTKLFAIFSSLCYLVTAAQDFYKLLGVSKDATVKEIKKAYRQKSLEFHPDKNKDENAAETFSQIARAYEVLSDDEKRKIYNRHGEEGLKQHEQQSGMQDGFGGGFDDIFSHFFGGGGGGGGRRQQRERQTPSVELPMFLTLQQLYLGETFHINYERQVLCLNWEMCLKSAPECQGPGVKVIRQQVAPGFVQQFQQHDSSCVAQGKRWKTPCSSCPQKTQTESIPLTVDIQKGMRDGEIITFEGVTDEQPGHTPGDLKVVIVEQPNDTFHRDRDDLYKTFEVPLVDALTGFSISLTHLDDKEFTVQVEDVTDCDHVLRVPGKGMPRRNGRGFGDLYLTFEVDFPDRLTVEQKKAIREILGDSGDSVNIKNGEL
ncbi:hypothetical protein MPSEU_000718600 [Mayamaea pseudoterrestris]|nr:hypothetical protein MPSEU_000718600 [Mayamaea pseudoterrestris]